MNRATKADEKLKQCQSIFKEKEQATAIVLNESYQRIYEANKDTFEYYSFSGYKTLAGIISDVFGKAGSCELGTYLGRITSSIKLTCRLANVSYEDKSTFVYSEGVLPILFYFLWLEHFDKRCVKLVLSQFVFN